MASVTLYFLSSEPWATIAHVGVLFQIVLALYITPAIRLNNP